MNNYYVNIKVDREERPDVDRLYMMFLQGISGGGGWPMSIWLTPELHPFFAGADFAQSSPLSQKRGKKTRSAVGNLVSKASKPSNRPHIIHVRNLATNVFERLQKRFDSANGGFGTAPKFPSISQTTYFLSRFTAYHLGDANTSPQDLDKAKAARDMALKTMTKIYNGGIRDVVGGGSLDTLLMRDGTFPTSKRCFTIRDTPFFRPELYQLLPSSSQERVTLGLMAKDIISYVGKDLTSPEGGSTALKTRTRCPRTTAPSRKRAHLRVDRPAMDELLGPDAELFKYHFGVEQDGNCDPRHDIQGELKGQAVDETAQQFGRLEEEAQTILARSLATLRDFRDKNRPRPHLDDKVISGLSRASEVFFHKVEVSREVLKLAENSAAFVRRNLYDEASGTLSRSFREGKGPVGQADDYAFLIQGLLDLYEAGGKEEYALWAIRLQAKQDELFYDPEGGGYFASAPDEHILIRMKDAQDGAEPSAASITLSNLQRLSHFDADSHTAYSEKAQSIVISNGQILNKAPFVSSAMLSAALMADKGYMQFIHTGSPHGTPLLQTVRTTFIPNRVLIHLDPTNPPRELAKVNSALQSLIEGLDKGEAPPRPGVRICENFACGLPITEVSELSAKLPRYE
ncbi:Six-hairpin glycosidase-like protein [Epithele typhae]|uniref:Six-hairpin glycosidase-like protein n=1 Tax=Epithele typhae TaxID=378194 RepID=UPI00200863DD|nr:Six-hairpin glycosidase-like protein [Epithele typhae]KAH9930526.1 Six-hairpin glycosidase-like protein [Epithele typhae]